ncbi:peptidase S8 [Kribbella antibiotica]|uniref:Peptidase S8 n=1 Tax=Kribbella antibiotica TaxID=190195 RepID=A0A4V2YLB5_9ACTN|nr:S8 family serine peptidase [Kribbella antibiotica]TDD45887.1 peptidase S8 [Kribbella antibiotica]
MSHRSISALVAAAVALTVAAAPSATAAPPKPAKAESRATTITLITGDRLDVTSRPGQPDHVTAQPGSSSSLVVNYSAGHTIAVPSSAAADVRSGRLDISLFDITTLLAERRDDAQSKTLPVIVEYTGAAAKTPAGTTSSRALTSIRGRAATVDKSKARDFWRSLTPGNARVASTIRRVTLDRRVQASTDWSVPQIGVPAAWQRGFTGKGVKVAILDTGIDGNHPDLKGRITAEQNFSESADSADHFGHGTHVAGIAAGNGTASTGKYTGVARDATLLNGKVLGDDGFGLDSSIIAGMEWAVQQGAKVVNLSLGGRPTDGTDELSTALNNLSRSSGVLFVVAAGNCRTSQPAQVSSPAAADEALAVGNLVRDGSLAPSSCRGPRSGDGALKPEISAPGTDIVAARASGTDMGNPVDDNYTSATGTSMATPHVAGVAALVAQANPSWKAGQLKARLISTADPQQAGVSEEGAGRVDADQATAADVSVDSAELELGTLTWPHPTKDPVTRELTYRNPTKSPVTLQLAATMTPAAATPRLSATSLTVPAEGEASVTVTADRAAAGTGAFSGRITATAADADPIVTTFGWYAEAEVYPLTIKGIGGDGKPATAEFNLARVDGSPVPIPPSDLFVRNGTATLRLPPGRYVVTSVFEQAATDARNAELTLLSSDELDLKAPLTVTLDARKAQPVQQSVQGKPELTPRGRAVSYSLRNNAGLMAGGFELTLTSSAPLGLSAVPGGAVSVGSSEFAMTARLEVPPYRAKVVGGSQLEVRDVFWAPRFTGTKVLTPADAGTAASGEPIDVRGKLAVIAVPEGTERQLHEIVKVVADAGAAAAMLYNPDLPSLEAMSLWWASDETPGNLPVMRGSRATAKSVLDQKRPVELTGVAAPPYLYDLMEATPRRIPAKTAVTVTPKQLATVQETFGVHSTEGGRYQEQRLGRAPGGALLGANYLLTQLSTPATRTSYVQANSIAWSSEVMSTAGHQESSPRTFRPGEKTSYRWMAPILVSGLQEGFGWNGDAVDWDEEGRLAVRINPLVHRQEYTAGLFNGEDASLVLERNGVEVATANDTSVWVPDLSTEPAKFKLSLTTRRAAESARKYSTEIRSNWTWTSKGGSAEVMPLITADLDLPTADVFGRVPAGQAVPLTFGLRHQTRSARSPITAASLEISSDGTTWTKVPLTRTGDGQYTAKVTATRSPSLRVTGTDALGNSLQQTIVDAYGVK